jgi:glutamate/tyrosine decarboxylase-like PLP-dependent enzyme
VTQEEASDLRTDILQALEHAAAQAIAYRRSTANSGRHCDGSYRALLASFDGPTPELGVDPLAVIDELIARSAAGLNPVTGPRFFGWVIGASHPVGVAADWLTAAWGQNAANHVVAPAAAAIETIAARWLLDLMHLPAEASVGFVSGATTANFVCLAAARSEMLRRSGWDAENDGLFGAPPINVLLGDDAHTTVFSALQFLGLGRNRVIRVKTDEAGRMIPAAFTAAIASCSGPTIAIAQAGQINTGAFDPIRELVTIAHAHGAWFHIDGAFGLWARACATLAALADGAEDADSWAVDGHKWLQVPYDCGYAIVRDHMAHRRSMAIVASYLPPVDDGERDPSHFVPELSRRARGFATWAMIRHLGRTGISAMIERHCDLAAHIGRRLAAEPGVYVLNDVVLNQVVVRFGSSEIDADADRMTEATIALIQSNGECFVGGARWRDRWVMRLSLISVPMNGTEIDRAADAICAAWRNVSTASKPYQESSPGASGGPT